MQKARLYPGSPEFDFMAHQHLFCYHVPMPTAICFQLGRNLLLSAWLAKPRLLVGG